MDFFQEGSEVKRSNTLRAALITALLLGAWGGSAAVQMRVDREIVAYRDAPDLLWVTSPQAVKVLSLGHEGLLANIYWTRVVQYFGRRVHERRGDYHLLYPLLDITTSLDPHFLLPYYFGAFFLSQEPPAGAGEPLKAIQLLEKGLQANPDNWRFYHYIGFIYYWDLQEYEKAAAAYREGAKNPAAHIWMEVMAAQILETGGSRETSFFLWSQIYNSTNDESVRENALGHLHALQSQKDIEEIESVARSFHGRTGKWPTSIRELVAAGLLRQAPIDPSGHPYQLTANDAGVTVALHPESTVKLEFGTAPKPPAPSLR
jgi:tetratricopeptide (TPR) repeat protein